MLDNLRVPEKIAVFVQVRAASGISRANSRDRAQKFARNCAYCSVDRMSEQLIEKREKFGKDAKGELCSEGYYAASPKGELVLIPPTAGLVEGWRLATIAEVDAKIESGVVRAANWGEYVPPDGDPPRDPQTGNRI